MTRQFLRLAALRVTFFEKTKKKHFRYGLGECVYQISGLYRFSFSQEVPYDPQTDKYHRVKIGISSIGFECRTSEISRKKQQLSDVLATFLV